MEFFIEKSIISLCFERMRSRATLRKWAKCKVIVRVNKLTEQCSICVLGELREMQVACRVTCITEMKGIKK